MSNFILSVGHVSILVKGVFVFILFGVAQSSHALSPAVELFKPDSQGQISVILRSRVASSDDQRVSKGKSQQPSISAKEINLVRATRFERHFSGLLGKMNTGTNRRQAARFNDPSLRSMRVSQSELAQLRADPEVDVYANLWHRSALMTSVPLVFPNQGSAAYDGNSQVVALLDSGVDNSHSFLSGAIIDSSSACFSNDNNGPGSVPGGESLCPGALGSVIGSGAGDACDATIDNCQHGTQMAGIIAGAGSGMTGVATGARVVPIKVATKSTDIGVCGDASVTPCIGFLTTDLIRALEYVLTISGSTNIAAVNVSFGSSATFQGQCDSNPESSVVDSLAGLGIAVIASSGNDTQSNEMTSPACISSVISVASTDDSAMPVASAFNNRNSELDFFAPGQTINTSSLPISSFADASGTSAAAAHVAGAWAVLKEKNPGASVGLIKNTLASQGIVVTQGLISKPFIKIDTALAALPEPLPVSDEFCLPIKTSVGKVAFVCL